MDNLSSGKKGINNWVFWPPFLLLLLTVVISFISYDAFTKGINAAFGWVINYFGWLFALSSFGFIVICVIVALSPAGKIKFGGPEAKPDFSTWNWFAMSLCAGIAIGIVFWGAAEPINHLASPPVSLGIEPFSPEAAVFSISTVFLHWTFTPYALYVVCAIPIALAFYNYKQPFTVSSSLYFIMGEKCRGPVGKVVDCLCLFAVAGGVASSLGLGILQVGSGLNYMFGIEASKLLWATIAALIIASYTLSSYTGINRGIRFLSSQNLKLFLGVMIFVFVFGPTKYILDLGVQGLGDFIYNFVPKSLFLAAGTNDQWPAWWSLFYWACWMAYAPIVGMFLARIVKGRTIREFITVNLVAPAIFGMTWFAIFGATSIHMQLNGIMDLWANITNNGLENTVFAFLGQLPLGIILVPVFLVTICISFITLADSMTTCVATISTSGLSLEETEPPGYLKIIWGVVMGSMAWVMISFAGVEGAKMIAILAGFPIMFLMIAMAWSLLKGLYSPDSLPYFGKKEAQIQSSLRDRSETR